MLIIFITIWGVIWISNNISNNKIREENTNVVIDFCTSEIEGAFNHYFDILAYYNYLINDFAIIDNRYRRNFYNELTKNVINRDTKIKALWVDFDANKLDSLDDQYKNTDYYSENGRFSLYWNKVYNRRKIEIEFKKYSEDEQQLNLLKPCYEQAKTTKKPTITMDNSDESNIVFTFSLPVFDKDSNVIGVTGLEIDIKDIISSLDNYKMKLVKTYTLLSNEGVYLYNFDTTIIGKVLSKQHINYNNTDSILKELPKNETVSIEVIDNKEPTTYFFIPIKVKDIYNTNTYITLLINNTSVDTDSDRFIGQVFQYCFIFFILLSIVIFFSLIIIEDILLNRIIASLDDEKIKKLEG